MLHLGDDNVPNALMFIDKYTQVPRILSPICACLRELPRLAHNKATKRYFDEAFGGVEALKLSILADFFRSAFDGSGADTFFAAGSCVWTRAHANRYTRDPTRTSIRTAHMLAQTHTLTHAHK